MCILKHVLLVIPIKPMEKTTRRFETSVEFLTYRIKCCKTKKFDIDLFFTSLLPSCFLPVCMHSTV